MIKDNNRQELWAKYKQLIIDKNYDKEQGKTMGMICFTIVAHKRCGSMEECFKKLIAIVEESKTEEDYIRKARQVLLGE